MWLQCSVVLVGGHCRLRGMFLVVRGSRQSPVRRSRGPVRIGWLWCVTVTWLAVKCALQPTSQSLPMEMRELWVKSGKTCASFASLGSCGRDSSQVSVVERKYAPLGRPTSIGCWD